MHREEFARAIDTQDLPDAESFWKLIRRGAPTDCWPLIRTIHTGLHGQIMVNRRRLMAHRIAYALTRGPIPHGAVICHTCDYRPCCNPSHLFLGTIADNNADMYQKGRNPCAPGERNGSAKLTDDQVRQILNRYESKNISTAELAREYGVHEGSVQSLLRGQSWKHITGGRNVTRRHWWSPPNKKLSSAQKDQIQKICAERAVRGRISGAVYREIADQYGVAPETIRRIVSSGRHRLPPVWSWRWPWPTWRRL